MCQVDPEVLNEVATASEEFREVDVDVPSASKSEEGTYQCQASNVYGSGIAKWV